MQTQNPFDKPYRTSDKNHKLMEEDKYSKQLEDRGIKPTAIRILVLKTISDRNEIFSLLDLEAELGSIDKSTLFRTLTLFQQHRVIHSIDDGSGSLKYSICDTACDCSAEWQHVHFYCISCKHALCLRDVHIPIVDLPEGYEAIKYNFVIKGYCDKCRKFANKLQ